MSDNIFHKLENQAQELKETKSKLALLIDWLDLVACSKCGYYHAKSHICYACGHDDGIKEDK